MDLLLVNLPALGEMRINLDRLDYVRVNPKARVGIVSIGGNELELGMEQAELVVKAIEQRSAKASAKRPTKKTRRITTLKT